MSPKTSVTIEQLHFIGEHMMLLASIALGRRIRPEEDLKNISAELRQLYDRLPDVPAGRSRIIL